MAEIDTHSKVTTPRLGPAPARIGVAAASSVVDQPTSTTPVPRKLPWIAKRFGIWCFGTALSATAFHLTGFVLIGIVAIVFPIGYWAKVVFEGQLIWGTAISPWRGSAVLERMQRDSLNRFIPGTPEYRMYHID